MRKLLPAVILAAACATPGQTRPSTRPTTRPAAPTASTARSRHYSVYAETLPAADVAAMLEALHERLGRFFGRAPKGHLRVEVYTTRDRWLAAMRRDGDGDPGEGGGYYRPANRTAYLYVQPSEYFTRHLIVHEAAHQFHWLVATGNRAPACEWYAEGLVEYFAMHDWDGRRLRTGVVPAVTLEDYPARALKALRQVGHDMEAVIAGRTAAGRPLAWAMVHYLVNRRGEAFGRLRRRLDRREDPLAAWRAELGPVGDDLRGRLREWLEARQQPWRVVWTSWQQRGDAIEGGSRTKALAVLKRTPRSLSADVELIRGPLKAGIAFGYRSPRDFYLFQAVGPDRFRVVRRFGHGWRRVCSGRMAPATGRRVLSVKLDGGAAVLSADGKAVAKVKARGQVGLNADACRVRFRVTRSGSAEPAPTTRPARIRF